MEALLVAYGLVAVAELPDKSAVVALVIGARYRALPVWLGLAAAFAVHVTVAVLLGGLVASLPRTPVEVVTGLLFLAGAVLLLRSDPGEAVEEGEAAAEGVTARSDWQVTAAAFGVVLVAEFGDLTQVLTATLAARYDQPLQVGVGALLALWTVSALAVVFGRSLLRVLPLRRIQQVAAVALLALSALSLTQALA
ncbi:MAG: TMEM165/GDT1 family protein [Mycobacteriales bacterium]|nr:TMEM165/GDT1 family protein [Mycobacteriales bacterium]